MAKRNSIYSVIKNINLIIIIVCVMVSNACGDSTRENDTPTNVRSSLSDEEVKTLAIFYDKIPFTSKTAIFKQFNNRGEYVVVKYSNSLLVVNEKKTAALPNETIDLVFSSQNRQSVISACDDDFYTGNGLVRGDQFRLAFIQDNKISTCLGFIQEAPEAIQTFLTTLDQIDPGVTSKPAAKAFIRSILADDKRIASLGDSNNVVFIEPDSIPQSLQAVFQSVSEQTLQFIQISREEYDFIVATWPSLTRFYTPDGKQFFEIILFTANPLN